MSQLKLTIAGCYEKLLTDPSLLQLFSEDEWTSIHELPHMGTLCFHVMSEWLFAQVTSSVTWGQAGVEFISSSSRQTVSEEITPMVILVTEGISEGNLGLMTVYCQSDQKRVDLSDALSTLVRWDYANPVMVAVKVFTNMPFFLWGSSGYPYFHVTTPYVGTTTALFPLAHLQLCRLLPYSSTQVILPWENEVDEPKVLPIIKEMLWDSPEDGHHLCTPVHLSVPTISTQSNREASSQTKEMLGLSPSLRQLQPVTQAKVQLEWELPLKGERLAKDYDDQWARVAWEEEDQWARMAQRKRTSGPRWLSWLTPPSGRSALKWIKLIWWGCSLGFSLPLSILAQLLYALVVKDSPLPCSQGQMPSGWHNLSTQGLPGSSIHE